MSDKSVSPGDEHRRASIVLMETLGLNQSGMDLRESDAMLDVLSYFAKYLMVWDRDRRHIPGGTCDRSRMNPREQLWFDRWIRREAMRQLNSAPWLSHYHNRNRSKCVLRKAVDTLFDLNILRRVWRTDIFLDSSVADERTPIPVLQLTSPAEYVADGGDLYLADALDQMFMLAESRFLSRRDMLKDLGYGAPQVGPRNMRNLLNDITANRIVKISVYSGRTVFDNKEWFDRLKTPRSGVEYRILALGITVHSTLLEGAELTSYRRNVLEGILKLRDKMREMSPAARKSCKVRLCGHSLEDAYFRGFMVEEAPTSPRFSKDVLFPWKRTQPGSIVQCQATCWRFQEERGTYGEIALFGSETNLAELVREYYDEVFDRAIPLQFWGALWYPWRKLGVTGWTTLIGAGILARIALTRPSVMQPGDWVQLATASILGLAQILILIVNAAQMRPTDRYEILKYLPSKFIRKTLDGKSKIGNLLFPDIGRRI